MNKEKMKPGRPRSEKAREAVLLAVHDLLDESGGAKLTIEAVARRAGVGKPTIYRWWPSLADIVLEVVLRRADRDIPVPEHDTFAETLRRFLRCSMSAITDWGGPHLRFLIAHAQRDESFRQRFRDNFTAKRREVLKALLSQAPQSAGLDVECDADLLADILFGAMWYRLLIDHAPIDAAFADALTDTALALLRISPAD